MNTELFTHQQLFGLKKSTLEKRIIAYYKKTGDSMTTIQYLMALMIRQRLGANEFELVLQELVRHLFMQKNLTKNMKEFLFHFKNYFTAYEWIYLLFRCFSIRLYTQKALTILQTQLVTLRSNQVILPKAFQFSMNRNNRKKYSRKLVVLFKTSSGKSCRFTFNDPAVNHTPQEIKETLELLTHLDIFQKNDEKLFTEVISAKYIETIETPLFDNIKKEQISTIKVETFEDSHGQSTTNQKKILNKSITPVMLFSDSLRERDYFYFNDFKKPLSKILLLKNKSSLQFANCSADHFVYLCSLRVSGFSRAY